MSASDIKPSPITIVEMADDYCRRMKVPDYKLYIPPTILKSLDDYFTHHLPVGGFLTNVLENNLLGAITYGDDHSVFALPAIIAWLALNGDKTAWGSERNVYQWLKVKSLESQLSESNS